MRFIGGKSKLLSEIDDILRPHLDGTEEVFMDIFAGTGSVSRYFKSKYKIMSNDFMYFSSVLLQASIKNNTPLYFKGLKRFGINNPLSYLQNNHNKLSGFITHEYSPAGKDNRMYFTEHNASRIDFIRITIENWYTNGDITSEEYFYLLAVLIEAVPYISNITGTYGAFLKHWDKRSLNEIALEPIEIENNGMINIVYNEDANQLIKKVSGDILYIDPPYNTRQYVPNYHILETIARCDNPEINGVTGIRNYDLQKSAFSQKKNASKALRELISNADFKHIVLSYSTDGIISEEEIISILNEYNINSNVEVVRIPYRKYKSKVASKTDDTHELLFYIQKKPSNKERKIPSKNIKKNSWSATGLIKSPLNYIGGKYRLLKQILPLFPVEINTFVDLFSGGGNVGINVEANNYIFNDMNNRINEMFRYFSEQTPDDLVKTVKTRIDEYGLSKTNREAYLQFRRDYNVNPNPLDLYVLVSYSYNYQFRFNNSMEFNNPFGRNRSQFSENMERNLRAFVSKLGTIDATFTDKLFTDLDLSNLGKNDFVYLDPPYLITTGNYNDGNRGFVNWGEEQEFAMYELMMQLTNQGVRYALSNVIEHKERTNDYLKNFIKHSNAFVHYLNYNYGNSSYNTKRTGSVEVLVTNYDPTTFEIVKTDSVDFETV